MVDALCREFCRIVVGGVDAAVLGGQKPTAVLDVDRATAFEVFVSEIAVAVGDRAILKGKRVAGRLDDQRDAHIAEAVDGVLVAGHAVFAAMEPEADRRRILTVVDEGFNVRLLVEVALRADDEVDTIESARRPLDGAEFVFSCRVEADPCHIYKSLLY